MNDRKLYLLSLGLSIFGIFLISTFTYLTGPAKVKISSIDSDYEGQRINTEGVARDVYTTKDGHLFFHVKDRRDEIKVAVFREDMKEMGLDEDSVQSGDRLSITGDVKSWNNELEIIPVKIEKIP